MASSFTDLYFNAGRTRSHNDIENAKKRVREQDDLPQQRQLQLQRNHLPASTTIHKPDMEQEEFEISGDEQIVRTRNNPADIDPLYESRAHDGKLCAYSKLVYQHNVETGRRGALVRAIPHFDRLFANTMRYLPRYVFRVVHSESAGKVFADQNGVTHFWSHAFLQNECSSDFEAFSAEGISQQIQNHVGSYTKSKGKDFASHFISTTDSFECAAYWAQRHLTKRRVNSVAIYVIDTHSLRFPSCVFLMAQALRAYNVLKKFPHWRTNFFMYGALTEWIFWDRIVASTVEKIRYGTSSDEEPSDSHDRLVGLQNVVPIVMAATKAVTSSKDTISRSVIHKFIYPSSKQDREREEFASKAQASRNGPLPTATLSVKNDKRASISDKSLEDIWNIIHGLKSKNLLFIWILSLMTQTYYADSIIERVVVRYPAVIEESLEIVKKRVNPAGTYEKVLVYYMSGQGCLGRVDVNAYQKMMHDCVKAWQSRVHFDKSHKYHGLKLYTVTGDVRPLRNLVRTHQSGHEGRCKTESLLDCPQMILVTPFLDRLGLPGRQLKLPETDEEHRLRIERETGNVIYAPGGIPMVTTRRVYKDTSHHSTSIRSQH